MSMYFKPGRVLQNSPTEDKKEPRKRGSQEKRYAFFASHKQSFLKDNK